MNIPVDYYVRVNFHAFVDVVDAIGGINVDVPFEFTEQDSSDKAGAIHLYPGEQELDGEEALAFARTRKLDNDIERGKRQMEVVNAVADKATSIGSVLNFDDLIAAVGSNMNTNMSFKELMTFITFGTGGLDIESFTLEGSDYQPGSTYYWLLDEVALEQTRAMLQEHLEISSSLAEDEGQTTNEAEGQQNDPYQGEGETNQDPYGESNTEEGTYQEDGSYQEEGSDQEQGESYYQEEESYEETDEYNSDGSPY